MNEYSSSSGSSFSSLNYNSNNSGSIPSCSLCCNDYTIADTLYPIHCPTTQCQFQYCMKCIQNYIQSVNDGYTIASDGSQQVKVSIRCPMCRSSYRRSNNTNTNTNTGIVSPTTASLSIVTAILKLRQAALICLPITDSSVSNHNININSIQNRRASTSNNNNNNTIVNDSYLSASQLTERNEFVRNITIRELQDATMILQQYFDSIDTKDCGTVPTINIVAWEQYMTKLEEQKQMAIQNTSSDEKKDDVSSSLLDTNNNSDATSTNRTLLISRDPTLFIGLDELLTIDEQEFITQMFISGNVNMVQQASSLLHSIIMTQQQRKQQQRPQTALVNNSYNNTRRKVLPPPKTIHQVEYENKIRKLYPLPHHMPRVVTIQPYNPLQCKSPPIKFVKPSSSSSTTTATTTTTTTTSNSAASSNSGTTTETAAAVDGIQQPIATATSFFQRFKLSTSSPSPTTATSTNAKTTTNHLTNNNNTTNNNELTIASVHGMAGRVGLRRGDVITHINNEPISTYSEYVCSLQYILEQQQQGAAGAAASAEIMNELTTITVNVNEVMAQQLRTRAQQMKQNNVRF